MGVAGSHKLETNPLSKLKAAKWHQFFYDWYHFQLHISHKATKSTVWLISPASLMVICIQLSACPGEMEPFKDQLNIHIIMSDKSHKQVAAKATCWPG